MTDEPIRSAATVVLWRETPDGPQVLMGQRGEGAAAAHVRISPRPTATPLSNPSCNFSRKTLPSTPSTCKRSTPACSSVCKRSPRAWRWIWTRRSRLTMNERGPQKG